MKKSFTILKSYFGALLFVLFLSLGLMQKQVSANVIGVNPGAPVIEVYNEATWGAPISSATLTMAGFVVDGAVAVTWNSDNLLFYAIIRDTSGARHLATVDPGTGVCTRIGTMSSTAFSSLTYNSDLGILYTMGGTGGPVGVEECLFSVNITTAATTFLAGPFPVGGFGEVISYNYDNNLIYHWSGDGPTNLETINPTTFLATPIIQTGAGHSEISGAVYRGGGLFSATDLVFQGATNGYNITSTGVVSLVGPIPHRVRGLGYVDPILPVELTSFVSSINRNDVTLNWTTATETNNSGFDVERSANGQWSKVGFVSGNGMTTSPTSYSFVDRGLTSGKYNYRLKQNDFSGNFEYFNLINEVEIGVPGKYDLSQNYPNPFNPSTIINYQLPSLSNVKLSVYDIGGKEVKSLVNGKQEAGYYIFKLNASDLTSGIYFYTLTTDNFVETKKMILVK